MFSCDNELCFFKALANENRLKIIGILADHECSVGELADLVGLEEPTISHHLSKLRHAGIVTIRVEGNDHLHRLDIVRLKAVGEGLLTTERVSALASDTEYDAWEKKVLRTFLREDEILAIPAGYKKRLVVLKWLVDHFEFGVQYHEKQVNAIINRHHADHSALRRYMVDNGLMKRNEGFYWRVLWRMPDLSA